MIGQPPTGQRPPSDYQNMHDQWSDMPPPDPATLMKLILSPGFLTKHQMDAIKALMTAPGAAEGGPSQAQPAGMPAAAPMGGLSR